MAGSSSCLFPIYPERDARRNERIFFGILERRRVDKVAAHQIKLGLEEQTIGKNEGRLINLERILRRYAESKGRGIRRVEQDSSFNDISHQQQNW